MAQTGKGDHQTLRFGIMCDGTTLSAWQARCLEKLLKLDNIELCLLIINDNYSAGSTESRLVKLLKNPNYLNSLVWWITYRFFFINRSKAFSPVDLSQTFENVPSIRCRVIKKGDFSEFFSDSDIEIIRNFDLDFILRFGFNIIRGKILDVPRFGIWSFHHGDEEKYRGMPPGFWEIFMDDPITGAVLQRITDRLDAGTILRKGFFKTQNSSYVQNLDNILFESSDWPAQVCLDILRGNADYFKLPPSQTTACIFRAPSNIQTLLFIKKMIFINIKKMALALLFEDQWNIGIVNEPIHSFLQPDFKPCVFWLSAKQDGFIADPFAIYKNGQIHILFESYDYSKGKGDIFTINISDKSISKAMAAICSPFHLSYPYLIEYNEEIYCLPEISEAREIRLYKADAFPYQWSKVASLIKDFSGIDPTLFQYLDYWWIFATDAADGNDLKLRLWYSQDIFGPWKPHARNPVKVDIRSARSAGTPFVHNDQLYRPSQDCSEKYGGRIAINRIKRLTPTEFEEEIITFVEPDKKGIYRDGVHTISSVGDDMTLIDGFQSVFIGKNPYLIKDKISIYLKYLKRRGEQR